MYHQINNSFTISLQNLRFCIPILAFFEERKNIPFLKVFMYFLGIKYK